ncbi:hypothetical protein AZE42_03695 [Rhizopogon vesiculosus]|uniref:Uncharacterized protein n=1 Tax=Rhizopogon vesiculosus TaxID=180088 RepID=A0A1J8QTG1_9AGAM|nr:hypothetical protein AZE42_03695 [Rhizopogon vesiculosus]
MVKTAAESLGLEFSIETWPVADRCKGPLEDLVSLHDIQPLLAYDEKHISIPLFQYESELRGPRRGARSTTDPTAAAFPPASLGRTLRPLSRSSPQSSLAVPNI